jgi:hypothetical protein
LFSQQCRSGGYDMQITCDAHLDRCRVAARGYYKITLFTWCGSYRGFCLSYSASKTVLTTSIDMGNNIGHLSTFVWWVFSHGKCTCVGWPEPYIYTVYDRIFGDFSAKNTAYTLSICGPGQLYTLLWLHPCNTQSTHSCTCKPCVIHSSIRLTQGDGSVPVMNNQVNMYGSSWHAHSMKRASLSKTAWCYSTRNKAPPF